MADADIRASLLTPDAQTWDEFIWPDWVPEKVRQEVKRFWSCFGRGPQNWIKAHTEQGALPLGTVVTLPDGFRPGRKPTTGRFVFAWNNIARLVRDDGSFAYTSFYRDIQTDPARYRRECEAAFEAGAY